MKEHIVIVDEGQTNQTTDLMKNVDNAKESISIIADSFTAVAEKMKDLSDLLKEQYDVDDPMGKKRLNERTFKENVSQLKHVKKRGKW